MKNLCMMTLIVLRKMNNERFLVNHNQIECIELIPECKIVMMNHDYYLVKDTVEEIIQKLEAGEDVDKQAFVDEVAFASDDTVTKVTIDGTDYDITPITQEIIDGRAY